MALQASASVVYIAKAYLYNSLSLYNKIINTFYAKNNKINVTIPSVPTGEIDHEAKLK